MEDQLINKHRKHTCTQLDPFTLKKRLTPFEIAYFPDGHH